MDRKPKLWALFQILVRIGGGLCVVALAVGLSITLHPVTPENLAGHLLTWSAGLVVAFAATVPPLDEEASGWRPRLAHWPSFEKAQIPQISAAASSTERVAGEVLGGQAVVARRSVQRLQQAFQDRGLVRPQTVLSHSTFHEGRAVTTEDCHAFAQRYPVCFMATLQGDEPHVHTVVAWYPDPGNLHFILASPDGLSAQIEKHPHNEICFYNQPSGFGKVIQMRISGNLERVQDEALLHNAALERELRIDVSEEDGECLLKLFRLREGDVHFWTMFDPARERVLKHVAL